MIINKKIVLILLLVAFFGGCGLIRTEGDYLVITSSPNPVGHTQVALIDPETEETYYEYKWEWETSFINTGAQTIIVSGATMITNGISQEIFVGPIKIVAGATFVQDFIIQSGSISSAAVTYIFKCQFFEGASFTKTAGITLS